MKENESLVKDSLARSWVCFSVTGRRWLKALGCADSSNCSAVDARSPGRQQSQEPRVRRFSGQAVLLSANFLFFGKVFHQNSAYVSPLAGLKIIIRLTLGFYVAGPLGRQYDAHQPPSTTSTQSTTSTTAAKRQKPRGRHIKAQGKPGRQARRSPGEMAYIWSPVRVTHKLGCGRRAHPRDMVDMVDGVDCAPRPSPLICSVVWRVALGQQGVTFIYGFSSMERVNITEGVGE